MSDFAQLVPKLLCPPGDSQPATSELLAQVAFAHERLLERAAAGAPQFSEASAEILELLRTPAMRAQSQKWLCDPLLVAGLHRLSRAAPALAGWHRAVAAPSILDVACRGDPADGACLGHVLLALRLRSHPSWRGEICLETDAFGRVEFPGSDWLLALSRARDGPHHVHVLAGHKIVVAADAGSLSWASAGNKGPPFLKMSRDDAVRMLVEDDEQLDAGRLAFDLSDVRPVLLRKVRIPGSPVRYDPVSFEDFAGHAPLTGGIVSAVLEALRRCSPDVAEEFGRLIHTVRGFEVPESAAGTIQSFSDPSLPGVMSINVPFTGRHEPRLCPLCFTWFGHELGHTKSYHLETIAHVAGEDLLKNGPQSTEFLPRYGRALRLRTLLQIPYTHLYEWQVLADFLQRGFQGLPWSIDVDPVAAGNDLRAEIEEAFALLNRRAELTTSGRAVVEHLQNLQKQMIRRWECLVSSTAGVPRAVGRR